MKSKQLLEIIMEKGIRLIEVKIGNKLKYPKDLVFDIITRNYFLLKVTANYNIRDNRTQSFKSYLNDFVGNYKIIAVDMDNEERWTISGDYTIEGNKLILVATKNQ